MILSLCRDKEKVLLIFVTMALYSCSVSSIQISDSEQKELFSRYCRLLYSKDFEKAGLIIKNNPWLVHLKNDNGISPLHYTVSRGNLELVALLLKKGADSDVRDVNNSCPLHYCNVPGAVTMLLKFGANHRLINNWGETPMQGHAEEKNYKIIDEYLSFGIELDFFSALYLGKRDLVKSFVNNDPSVLHQHIYYKGFRDNTPLGIAVSQGDFDMVQFFVEKGAPINGGTYDISQMIYTPVSNAVFRCNIQILRYLLENGAMVDSVYGGKYHTSIVSYAKEKCSVKVVELLLKHESEKHRKKREIHEKLLAESWERHLESLKESGEDLIK